GQDGRNVLVGGQGHARPCGGAPPGCLPPKILPLGRPAAGGSEKNALGRPVSRAVGDGDYGARGRGHDPAFPALEQVWPGGLDQPQGAVEVDRHVAVELVGRGLSKRKATIDAGVVDDDVQSTKRINRRGDYSFRSLRYILDAGDRPSSR